jgi:hypothetical protein
MVVHQQLQRLLPSPIPPLEQQQQQQQQAPTDDVTAADSNIVAVQATLDILVKSGTPTHVMAGLQVIQPRPAVAAYSTSSSSHHYSAPPWTAQQWITFGSVVEPDFRVVFILSPGNGTDDDEKQPNEPIILAVASTDDIRVALENLGQALQQPPSCSDDDTTTTKSSSSSSSPLSSLEQGFHIVSLPLKMTMTSRDVVASSSSLDDDLDSSPTASHHAETDVTADDPKTASVHSKKVDWVPLNVEEMSSPSSTSSSSSSSTVLTCLATAEVNARELLSLDALLLEMTVTSILQVPLTSL